MVTRRTFISGTIGLAATHLTARSALAAPPTIGTTRPRVVFVGGGAGGATAALHLATIVPHQLDITLVEPQQTYRTCFFQNLKLAGLHGGLVLDHRYDALHRLYGITLAQDVVTAIDASRRRLSLASGAALSYDRLVLSPGIDLKPGALAGYDDAAQTIMPHCWKSSQPIEALIARLTAMRAGGTVAIVVPANPYRCPPGPYERASMVASLLSRTNPTAKVLVIDDKDAFSKQALFLDGWKRHYGGMVEWLPRKEHGGVTRVDASAGLIVTAVRDIRVDVANVVPPQQAGAIAFRAGLTDAGGWCPIIAETMTSRADPDIHIIGDATRAAAMPKSAESAANQARIAADTIAEVLTGIPSVRSRIANSCWSLIAADDGVKIGGTYAPNGNEFAETSTYVSMVGEHPSMRAATYRESLGWYQHVTSLMFGTIPA